MSRSNGDYLSLATQTHGLGTLSQWDQHIRKVLKGEIIQTTDRNTSTTKNCIVKVNQTSHHDNSDSTSQLRSRRQHIHYWRTELERAIRDITTELKVLGDQREQVLSASCYLLSSNHMNEACLRARTRRVAADLTHDEPQEALYNESNLIQNVKRLHQDSLRDIDRQMDENIAAKEALERDWSNKCQAYKCEDESCQLEAVSCNVKDNPGSTKLSEGQSNVESWEQNTINILNQFKSAIDRSKLLRARIETTLINTSRDLRNQDIAVNKALSERISATQQVKTDLENQLKLTLQKIVETENILETLHDEIQKVSQRMRVAQTRLTIKNCRPNIENCREGSLLSVIDEVRDLNDCRSLLEKRVLKTMELRSDLIQERSRLENEITVKNKSLYVDNERCLFYRSHFESAEKLCGL